MTDNQNIPWTEKYRPRTLSEMKQTENLVRLFENNIKTGDMSHYLFYGPPGTGKTSAILAIGRELFREHFRDRVIEFNASDDRGINAVRDKITCVARKYVSEIIEPDGHRIPPYKIVILDEADSMTDEAQDALRVIIEQYSSVTRFCFICNYISKITDAIKSRCTRVYFKRLEYENMASKLEDIATRESIKIEPHILEALIDVSNGDMRKAILMLQNIKYLYEYRVLSNLPITEMPLKFLKHYHIPTIKSKLQKTVTDDDIYQISAAISQKTAHGILVQVLNCNSIRDIIKLAKNIISLGLPVDNTIIKLNQEISGYEKMTEIDRAFIIKYSGTVFLRIQECANEYLQLIDYLSCIHDVSKGMHHRRR